MHVNRGRGVSIRSVVLLALLALLDRHTPLRAQSTGGFVVADSSTAARQPLTAAQIAAFMPARGRFTFPAPYGTEGVRLTNASDCGGNDCVNGVGYAYWRNINNSAGSDTMLIVIGLNRNKGGTGPTLFSYNKVTGDTKNLGSLFDPNTAQAWGTSEGWYFSATAPTMFYLSDGPKMLRYDVLAKTSSVVFDVTTYFGANRYLWQMHSSNDDRVHSFTLKDGTTYGDLGCGVYLENSREFRFFAARGYYDECQIDKSGRYLLIKEDPDGTDGEDNVIEDLQTGAEQILYDRDGAAGHSDSGFGYQVAEDNWYSLPGAIRTWFYGAAPTDGSQGRLVFNSTSWDAGGGHIAHANAQPGWTISQQYACFSNASRVVVALANEVSCFRLDGSLQSLVVAPILTNLDAPGGGDDYTKLPKGNIDPTGEWFIWGTNMGTDRNDVVMVHIPLAHLPAPVDGAAVPPPPTSSTGTTTTAPSPAPAPSPTPTTVKKMVVGDLDGDGKADVTLSRSAEGKWYSAQSTTAFASGVSLTLGQPGDVPVAGDFDGDGRMDPTVFRSGAWLTLASSGDFSRVTTAGYGTIGDIPVAADYDGDGITDLAVYRPSNGVWYIRKSSGGTPRTINKAWGIATDKPQPGDFDGDGRADLAVFRPSNGVWYILQSSTGYTASRQIAWGISTDRPVACDFDGDGITDLAAYRNGYWYVLRSSTGFTSMPVVGWGLVGDVPIPADYDGDGRCDFAVFRPSNAGWYILRSTSNLTQSTVVRFGLSTDEPVLER